MIRAKLAIVNGLCKPFFAELVTYCRAFSCAPAPPDAGIWKQGAAVHGHQRTSTEIRKVGQGEETHLHTLILRQYHIRC